MLDVEIRFARPTDVEAIDALIRELAEYERLSHQVIANQQQLRDALFSATPHVYCHVVEEEHTIVGFALWFLTFSTFEGATGLYLEDLYVRESHRRQGIGASLLQRLAALCVERGYTRLQWWVLDWNEPSIEFYRSFGAVPMDEWTVYRVSGEALRKLSSATASDL